MRSLRLLAAVLLVGLVPELAAAQAGRSETALTDVNVTTTATLIDAADGNRVSLWCTNTNATIHARVGPSTITTTKGGQLRAGSSITITDTSAIYAIAESSVVTLACTKSLR